MISDFLSRERVRNELLDDSESCMFLTYPKETDKVLPIYCSEPLAIRRLSKLGYHCVILSSPFQ